MIRKAYWGVLASIILALAFATGCNSTTASPQLAPVTTLTAVAPFRQTQVVPATTYASPFTVTVTTNGTPVGGASVVFSVTPSSGGASGTFAGAASSATATTDAATGQAVSPAFTSNTLPGAFIVTASIPGNPTSTAIFTVINTLIPVTFTSTAGNGQSATVSTDFGTALTAKVVDGSGLAVVGALVTFTAPSTGASGTFADSLSNVTTAITDANGVATAATFTANATVGGPYTVTASVPDVQSATDSTTDTWLTTNFSLTNTPAP